MKNNPLMASPEPNQMGKILDLAMGEILGPSEVEAVMNLSGIAKGIHSHLPQDQQDQLIPASTLQSILEKEYGSRAGRGLALRIGRACFKYILREYGPTLGLTALAFRLLPLSARLLKGSEAFAGIFNELADQEVRLEQNERYIYWNIERLPPVPNGNAKGPVCMLAIGLLQEALYWVSGGRTFQVEEKNGLACAGRVCTIVIDRIPVS